MTDMTPFSFSENITEKEIASFLRATELFSNLSEQAIQEISLKFEVMHVNSGEIILKQGEYGDDLFIVVSGRLRTISHKLDTKEDFILNEISHGELIGELAILTQEPRAATVIAIRDSILLKLSKQSFDVFIKQNPMQMMSIVRSTIKRLLDTKKKIYYPISTIAIAPAGDNKDFSEFAKLFTKELSKYGSTLHLDKITVENLLLQNNIQLNIEDVDKSLLLSSCLNKQAAKYSYIVYETESNYSQWTRRCLRQADHVILVSNSDGNKLLGDIENEIFLTMTTKRVDLVLLYDNDIALPSGTNSWLASRKINQYHHIRKNTLGDLHRLIRILTGRSIALILGGGGARALAYIGVYKALNELGIPIDLVGGSSFGGLIAGNIAMERSPEMLIEKVKKYVTNNKKLFKYTFPLLSVNSGAALTSSLKEGFGEQTRIEDTWINFFCTASNLNTGDVEVLNTGLVWSAIRATVSLPAIFPPITNKRGELLIDGGMLNNLPVDVMRHLVPEGQIIAASTSMRNKKEFNIPDGVMSGWRILLDRFLKKKSTSYPRISGIILNSIGISNIHHEQSMLEEANIAIKIKIRDVDLLDFKAIDKLIQIGYFATMEKLSRHQFGVHSQHPLKYSSDASFAKNI